MAIVDGKIKCGRCKVHKDLADYIPSHQTKGSGTCRVCKREERREYYWRNPDRSREAARIYRRLTRLHSRERINQLARDWHMRNKEKGKTYNLRKYGLTLEEFKALLEKQMGKCGVCGTHKNSDGKSLYVDHCHNTGVIRGLLCRKCNTGIGLLGDNEQGLKQALKYLRGDIEWHRKDVLE